MRSDDFHLLIIAALLSCPVSAAAALSSTTTPSAQTPCDRGQTILPTTSNHAELRKRQDRTLNSICGYTSTTTDQCPYNVACRATILGPSNAYLYCSTWKANIEYYATTAYSSFRADQSCPSFAVCCSDISSENVVTKLFLGGSYTVTAFSCAEVETTTVYNAVSNLINTAKFSQSLAQATAPSTSSGGASSSTSAGGPSSAMATSAHRGRSSSSSGLSTDEKIGIGAGIGGGIGVVVIAFIIFLCWRRYEKKQDRKQMEIPSSKPEQSQATSYDPVAFQQIKQGPQQPESYSSLGRYSELAQDQAPSELLENRRWTELPENQDLTAREHPYELYADSDERRV